MGDWEQNYCAETEKKRIFANGYLPPSVGLQTYYQLVFTDLYGCLAYTCILNYHFEKGIINNKSLLR